MGIGIGIGSAVLVGVGAMAAGAAMSAAMTILAGIIGGVIIGAVVGGISAAVMGGDIGKGILYGAIGGAVTGGLSGYAAGAGTIAYGTASGVGMAAEGVGSAGYATQHVGGAAGIIPEAAAPVVASETSGALGGSLFEGAGTAAVQLGGQMLMGSAQEDMAKEGLEATAARDESSYEFQAAEGAANRATQLEIEKGRNLTTLEKTRLDNQMAMDNARLQYKLGKENLDETTAARAEQLKEAHAKLGRQQEAVGSVDIREGGAFRGGPSMYPQVRKNVSGIA